MSYPLQSPFMPGQAPAFRPVCPPVKSSASTRSPCLSTINWCLMLPKFPKFPMFSMFPRSLPLQYKFHNHLSSSNHQLSNNHPLPFLLLFQNSPNASNHVNLCAKRHALICTQSKLPLLTTNWIASRPASHLDAPQTASDNSVLPNLPLFHLCCQRLTLILS